MMSLQERLTLLKNENFTRFSAEIRGAILGDLQTLVDSGIVDRAPKVGDKCPDVTLPNQLGEPVRLGGLLQQGPVVLTFYRGGWCPYCNLELHAYQQVLPELKATGATLVAITPEIADQSLTTVEKNALEFEVLTDLNSEYARKLGLVFTVANELRGIYRGFGIDIEKHNGEGQFDVPLASTFIVDGDGTIAYAFVAADYTLRAEPAEIIKILKEL
jgi:peroxiredoxin